MKKVPSKVDVVIISAGPSGSIAAGLLVNKGYDVLAKVCKAVYSN